MTLPANMHCTAFDRHRRLASGTLREVVRATKHALEEKPALSPLIFDDRSSHQIEVDFRGTLDEVLARLPKGSPAPADTPARGPGRPKLGVVPREVTLLPRHWEWLGQQPGGASAVLRRLVEQAARGSGAAQRAREASEAVDRFMLAMTGDLAGHEEATRAFYRGERERFATLTRRWPADIREHLLRLAAAAWDQAGADR